MKQTLPAILAVIVLLSAGTSVYARGGGGCLEKGTPVQTPSGTVPVEQLMPGDSVVGFDHGLVTQSTVMASTEVAPEHYYELTVGASMLRATAEHPVETEPGVFRMASFLKAGDRVCLSGKGGINSGLIERAVRISATLPAYNLLVEPGGVYIAGGIMVHNKGCFLPQTNIRLANGTEIPISCVKQGDRLLSFTMGGEIVSSEVRRVLTHQVDEYLVVNTDRMVLKVTAEHPFYTGEGTFKTMAALKAGDSVYAFDGKGLSPQKIRSVKKVSGKVFVYNLQTDVPNTFFADGVAVHNKGGGCFPAGTLIMTPEGAIPVELLVAGDRVVAVNDGGRSEETGVLVVHETEDDLVTIVTPAGSLETTAEHPVRLAAGGFRCAGELKAGDSVVMWSEAGTWVVTVTAVEFTGVSAHVYNLTVGSPHTFIADGFVVHNKGGGFHSSSRGGSGGGGGGSPIPLLIIVGVIVLIAIIGNAKKAEAENLDYVYSARQVSKKAEKTLKLLAFLSKQDPMVAPEFLDKLARSTFLQLQKCWQARDYGPMKPLMMPYLYSQHCVQIAGMIRDHEINVIDQLSIDRVNIVNVRYTFKEEHREFTALITATACDYYLDDRTRAKTRGDDEPAQFQEFWTFQYQNKAWLLREIEQSRESDVLKEDNFFEQFTDTGVGQIYGGAAGKEGPVGPWLEKDSETKDTRIERMLNFLVQTDKIWTRQQMLDTARRTFVNLTAAREAGDPGLVKDGDLFPELAANLREEIVRRTGNGITMEFRNLCVRKVELVLVRNFSDNSKDEFVARIRAHAQRITMQRGIALQRDDDVTPFELYLTFGRLENQWRLKEFVLPADAGELLLKENIDQDSNSQQLEWYYKQKRAT